VDRYRSEVAGAEEKFRIAETQLKDTDSELEQITAMLASELRVMEEKQSATASLTGQRQETERAISSVANDVARLESRVSGLRGQISSVSQQRDGAEARLGILSGELEHLSESVAHFSARLQEAQSQMENAVADLELRAVQLADGEGQLRESQAGLAHADRQLRDAQRALAEKESKLEVLRGLMAGGEGFSEGTQAVLRGLDNPDLFKPAVLGALAQYIEVPTEYVVAVEAALGAHLQTIVMKDTMIAEAMIKTLIAKKMGRASLALRELDQHFDHQSESLALPEGAIDWLINKIKAQDEVGRIVERLINHTVLVPDLETALRVFPQLHGSAVVTLSGELLTGQGILHGGATTEAANSVLERKNQIHVLEAEVRSMRERLAELTRLREECVVAMESAQGRLDEAREDKQNAALNVSTIRGQLAMIEREASDAEKKQQNLEGERASYAARHGEAVGRVVALETDISGALEQIETLQARRSEAVNDLEVLRSQESELSGELNDLRVKVATERQRHTSLHHQREPMEARIGELADLIASRRQDILGYEQRAEGMLAENEEISGNLERLRGQVSEGEVQVAEVIEERAGVAGAVEELSNTLRLLRHRLSEAHDQRSRLEVKQTQLEMKLAALVEHVQKRYQIDLAAFERDLHGLRVAIRDHAKRQRNGGSASSDASAPGEAGAADSTADASVSEPAANESAVEAEETEAVEDAFAIDWERLESMVREIEQRVDSMGPVNLDAIQEYDELEQRYTFLEKQNTDLTNAREELLDVIQRINKTTKTLFAETFEKIRGNFQEMFIELFGGGKGNLILTDESDPLESGIDIVARPPGKQLQSISLLSGGEKTMTAVALLFSIYMVKPSPFCVLDEMDAPLDESNISRFIRILDRFVDQSQFIVISHHKRTIARADAIYGVTMEEHGVSRLVGVKFSKREDSGENVDVLGVNNPVPVPSIAETFGKSGILHSENLAGFSAMST
jgi:chromosome segregation protein